MADATATFNASGEATGPYPGSFAENQGSANMFDTIIHNQLSYDNLAVPFTITSGTAPNTTTITGTISHSQYSLYPDSTPGFGLLCNGATVAGLGVNTTGTYTATMQAPGQSLPGDQRTGPGVRQPFHQAGCPDEPYRQLHRIGPLSRTASRVCAVPRG